VTICKWDSEEPRLRYLIAAIHLNHASAAVCTVPLYCVMRTLRTTEHDLLRYRIVAKSNTGALQNLDILWVEYTLCTPYPAAVLYSSKRCIRPVRLQLRDTLSWSLPVLVLDFPSPRHYTAVSCLACIDIYLMCHYTYMRSTLCTD